MSKFRTTVTYPDGYEEILEDLFDSEEEAREAALYAISCWDVGAETLHMSNPGDYEYDPEAVNDADYEIEEAIVLFRRDKEFFCDIIKAPC